jgi:hypothetical protein
MMKDILQVHDVWVESVQHHSKLVSRLAGVDSPLQYPQARAQCLVGVEILEVYVSHEQISVWIR